MNIAPIAVSTSDYGGSSESGSDWCHPETSQLVENLLLRLFHERELPEQPPCEWLDDNNELLTSDQRLAPLLAEAGNEGILREIETILAEDFHLEYFQITIPEEVPPLFLLKVALLSKAILAQEQQTLSDATVNLAIRQAAIEEGRNREIFHTPRNIERAALITFAALEIIASVGFIVSLVLYFRDFSDACPNPAMEIVAAESCHTGHCQGSYASACLTRLQCKLPDDIFCYNMRRKYGVSSVGRTAAIAIGAFSGSIVGLAALARMIVYMEWGEKLNRYLEEWPAREEERRAARVTASLHTTQLPVGEARERVTSLIAMVRTLFSSEEL